jgi:hypothetical protein
VNVRRSNWWYEVRKSLAIVRPVGRPSREVVSVRFVYLSYEFASGLPSKYPGAGTVVDIDTMSDMAMSTAFSGGPPRGWKNCTRHFFEAPDPIIDRHCVITRTANSRDAGVLFVAYKREGGLPLANSLNR